MAGRPLVVFDFDGVIVDGMAEYWWSASHASRRLNLSSGELSPDQVPDAFRRLRPWVHHGWEMVLLASELPHLDLQAWLRDYRMEQAQALERRGWSAVDLQAALDETRRDAVRDNRSAWLQLHQPYPGLVERLQRFDAEGVDWAVLTTKTAEFTAELLDSVGLHPWRLDGREAGAKPEVLVRLQTQRPLMAFVEDRRATLEVVRRTPGLEQLPCLLVNWGYLRPDDRENLPSGIKLIALDDLAEPLARWP